MPTFLHAQRFTILFNHLGFFVVSVFLALPWLYPTTVTFDTDFTTNVGAGNIVNQGNPELARIFTYEEQGVFASAIPFTNPDPNEAPSHYHLFDETILPGVDTIGLLMGDDAGGVSFTVGGMTPTTPFDVLSLNVVQVGPAKCFPSFIPKRRSDWGNHTHGRVFRISAHSIPHNGGALPSLTATFGVPGEEAPEGGRLVLDNVQVNPVPEPSTIGLFGTGLAGLWWLRRRKHHQ